MQKKSTTTNLACLSQFISESLDEIGQIDVIYTDFSKAFDCLDHFILLNKLDNYGFSNALILLFKSYLLNRTQLVEYQNVRSQLFRPTSGVPQGSNLGPLLSLLFINDLPTTMNCHKLIFADDDCHHLQNCVSELSRWCNTNRLKLNIDKCCVLTYTKKKQPIFVD